MNPKPIPNNKRFRIRWLSFNLAAMTQSSFLVLIGSVALCAGLGTVHGFSVFLIPLETQFTSGRAAISLTYSIALLSITAAVLVGPRVFGRIKPAVFVLASGGMAAFGAVLSGLAGNVWTLWAAYGVIFGLANGFGYGFTLQYAAQAAPGREGLAMGIVTAAYALGAALSPPLFNVALEYGGFPTAMFGLAVVLVLVSVQAAVHFTKANLVYVRASASDVATDTPNVAPLWLCYGAGVLAGLMAIGHAAGIATERAPDIAGWIAPAILAVFNLSGAMLAGRAADIWKPGTVLTLLPALSLAALVLLMTGQGPPVVLTGLCAIGFAYGGTIAVWPAVIAKRVGAAQSARVYGRVFTAWGAAGLAGPWIAGALYDMNGDYSLALGVAAVSALAAIIGAMLLFPRR